MKRTDLLRYLQKHGCEFLREGSSHTVYIKRKEKKASTIPRHKEINENLCKKICKDLGVETP